MSIDARKEAPVLRILGIDPGSRITGYGLLEVRGKDAVCLDAGSITLPDKPLAERLPYLYARIRGVMETYRPQEVAIEEIFVYKNVASALVLGHARGVAMAAVMCEPGCILQEYGARAVKKTIVGTGAADKAQVAYVVRHLLRLSKMPGADATDALAVALCHMQHRAFAALL